jgi:hypothetical protein
MLCSDLVEVFYRDETGHPRRAMANLEDISLSGICIQVDKPIPLDTVVHISHRKGAFQGNVRYCLFREIGYFLGVQLAPDCQWSPDTYRPQHLLDLRTLVEHDAEAAVKTEDTEPQPQ